MVDKRHPFPCKGACGKNVSIRDNFCSKCKYAWLFKKKQAQSLEDAKLTERGHRKANKAIGEAVRDQYKQHGHYFSKNL